MPTARTLSPVAKLPADLAPRLWTLFAQTLKPLGFTPKSNYRLFYYWTRQTETLEQRCGLAFTDDTVASWFDYRFTSSLVSWAPVDDALALRTVERFQSLNREFARLRKVGVESDRVVAEQTYFASLDSAGPENAFARSEAPSLLSLAVETFESRREALDVLRDFDAGRFDATSSPYSFPPLIWNGAPCFGSDPIHNALTLAGLRFQKRSKRRSARPIPRARGAPPRPFLARRRQTFPRAFRRVRPSRDAARTVLLERRVRSCVTRRRRRETPNRRRRPGPERAKTARTY